jgi:hypothetical protein
MVIITQYPLIFRVKEREGYGSVEMCVATHWHLAVAVMNDVGGSVGKPKKVNHFFKENT